MDNSLNVLEEKKESGIIYNETVRDAIIVCAREEVRNILRDITAPTKASLKSRGNHFCQRSRPKSARQFGQLRKIKSGLQSKAGSHSHYLRRPATSHDNFRHPISSTISNAYSSKRSENVSSRKKRHTDQRVKLSSINNNDESDILTEKEKSMMSFVSSKWIQQSVKLVIGNDITEKEEKIKNLSTRVKKYETSMMKNTSDVTMRSNDGVSKQEMITKARVRPKTAIGTIHRPFHKPTTALERRISSNRPSTAHIVRAKADDFSKSLLDPINKLDTKRASSSSKSLPNILDENEWENELARHIVSVFNNKIVSEVKSKKREVDPLERQAASNTFQSLSNVASTAFQGKQWTDDSIRRPITPSCDKKKYQQLKESKKLVDQVRPRMIWMTGTGNYPVNWDALEYFTHFEQGANKTLQDLTNQGKYLKYVEIVKTSLCSSSAVSSEKLTKSPRTMESLWRQLVLMVNSFAIKLIQQRKYPHAIDLLDIAKNLLLYIDVNTSKPTIDELNGFIKDSLAYYYSRRDKPSAALQYITEATTIQKKRRDVLNIVKCHLHRSFILQQLNRYSESTKLLKLILKMVDDGSLDPWYKTGATSSLAVTNEDSSAVSGGNDLQIVLLVAVTYHNLCCLQLLKGQIGDACMNSQNCRRLCRLCLNVSNRYLIQFEETHMKAMNELFSIVCPKQAEKDAIVFQRLFGQLFDTIPNDKDL